MTQQIWTIDTVHSEIVFRIRHMMITTVTGIFEKYAAQMTANSDTFDGIKITFQAESASVRTRNKERDEKLRGEEFLNCERHPKITFVSTSVHFISQSDFTLVGEMTLRGITHTISLSGKYNGTITDVWGLSRAGFELNGRINRRDYGIDWDEVTTQGITSLADEVDLHMQVQMIRH